MMVLAILVLLSWLLLGGQWLRGMATLERLSRHNVHHDIKNKVNKNNIHDYIPPDDPIFAQKIFPRLSVVVPARNEAAALPTSVLSLLTQSHPNCEVIVVNDRSDDDSARVLEALQAAYPALTVITIAALPAGWLGKNHALAQGAQRASGTWLLFTDADVHYHPGALEQLHAYALTSQLEHLVALPRIHTPGIAITCLVSVFTLFFTLYGRPWRARVAGAPEAVGAGAFSLMTKHAYDAVGGMAAVAMRPDDDVRLGKRLKDHGLRQDAVFATDLLWLTWYENAGQALRGFHKNAFAALNYWPWLALMVMAWLLLTSVWPFVALWLTAGLTRWLWVASVAVIIVLYWRNQADSQVGWWYALLHPLGTLAIVYAIAASMTLALWRGGITWRGTFYSLADLRKPPQL
jgi:glycosyltransferase involved in cell wall biosynthesis